MDHPQESELIALAGGRTSPADAVELMRHVRICAACTKALEEIRLVNQSLTGWRDRAEVDLVEHIEKAIDVMPGAPVAIFPWWLRSTGVAALVAVSLIGGHLLGRAQKTPVVDLPAAEAQLQLEALASADRTGLAGFIDDAEEVMP
jgi:anti-sigma factor ChrR (cupin superfamily)